MSRRVRLPGADELFRVTGSPIVTEAAAPATRPEPDPESDPAPTVSAVGPRPIRRRGENRPTGRERHEEKITVYCSAEELIALEQARLALRAEHGIAVDRGRIVREGISFVLADLQANTGQSILVRRLING